MRISGRVRAERNDYFSVTVAGEENISRPQRRRGGSKTFLSIFKCVSNKVAWGSYQEESSGKLQPARYLSDYILFRIVSPILLSHPQASCFTPGPRWEPGPFCLASGRPIRSETAPPANKHLPDSQVACLRDAFSNLSSCTLGDFQTKVIVVSVK